VRSVRCSAPAAPSAWTVSVSLRPSAGWRRRPNVWATPKTPSADLLAHQTDHRPRSTGRLSRPARRWRERPRAGAAAPCGAFAPGSAGPRAEGLHTSGDWTMCMRAFADHRFRAGASTGPSPSAICLRCVQPARPVTSILRAVLQPAPPPNKGGRDREASALPFQSAGSPSSRASTAGSRRPRNVMSGQTWRIRHRDN